MAKKVTKKIPSRKKKGDDVYKVLLENIPQKVFFKDKNSTYIFCNSNYAKDFKIETDKMIGKNDYDFYPKEFADKYRADDKRIMERGRTEDIEEKYISDGEERFVHTIKTPVRDEKSEVIGILGIFWDITEEKRADEELKKYRNHLEKLVKERTAELTKKTRVIQQQAQEILEISTPVLQVWKGIVVAPLIGTLDSQRTQQFMEKLLESIIETNSPVALVGIIDGLGHGQWAHRASQTARRFIESHYNLPLGDIFRGVARMCRATRGVVMALARFDWGPLNAEFKTQNSEFGIQNAESRQNQKNLNTKNEIPQSEICIPHSGGMRLTFASIGNIEARFFDTANPIRFITRRGIIGMNAPNPVVTENIWECRNIMVLHTDGLRSHWQRRDFPEFEKESAKVISQRLLGKLAKDDDDATVIVVKGQVA